MATDRSRRHVKLKEVRNETKSAGALSRPPHSSRMQSTSRYPRGWLVVVPHQSYVRESLSPRLRLGIPWGKHEFLLFLETVSFRSLAIFLLLYVVEIFRKFLKILQNFRTCHLCLIFLSTFAKFRQNLINICLRNSSFDENLD